MHSRVFGGIRLYQALDKRQMTAAWLLGPLPVWCVLGACVKVSGLRWGLGTG